MKEMTLTRSWSFSHQGLYVKICHTEGTTNEGFGSWCYYVTIPEHSCPSFEELWLTGKICKIIPESKGFVLYPYSESKVADVDWHAGVTFYAKHGEIPGFRSVEFGCDYSHLWDSEGGFENIDLEGVKFDALKTAVQLAELLQTKKP